MFDTDFTRHITDLDIARALQARPVALTFVQIPIEPNGYYCKMVLTVGLRNALTILEDQYTIFDMDDDDLHDGWWEV